MTPDELTAELERVRFAARMPDSFHNGLPAWINRLYVFYVERHESDGRLIPRSEDVETIAVLQAEVRRLNALVNELNEERRADRLALLNCLDGDKAVYELHEKII